MATVKIVLPNEVERYFQEIANRHGISLEKYLPSLLDVVMRNMELSEGCLVTDILNMSIDYDVLVGIMARMDNEFLEGFPLEEVKEGTSVVPNFLVPMDLKKVLVLARILERALDEAKKQIETGQVNMPSSKVLACDDDDVLGYHTLKEVYNWVWSIQRELELQYIPGARFVDVAHQFQYGAGQNGEWVVLGD